MGTRGLNSLLSYTKLEQTLWLLWSFGVLCMILTILIKLALFP